MERTAVALNAWGQAVGVALDGDIRGAALVRVLAPLAHQLGATACADGIGPTAAYAMLHGALRSVEAVDAIAAGRLRETAVFAYFPSDAAHGASPARPARIVFDAPSDGLERRV